MRVHDTNHDANVHDMCPRQQSQRTLLPTFPVHCNRLNSISVTKMGLLRTGHRLCRKQLDSRHVETVVCDFHDYVSDFHRNFMTS